MAFGYLKDDQAITVAIAEDLSPTFVVMNAFQQRFSMIAGVLLVILVMVQILILRLSFRPLARLQKQLKALERGERSQIDNDVPLEVSMLVSEFNRLLKVLDQRLQRSRNALADLAHALKTPLTVLQQLPREEVFQKHPELTRILISQTTNMQHKTTVHLAYDSPFRFFPPVDSGFGVKINDYKDIIVDKLLAFFARSEPRDAADLFFIWKKEDIWDLADLARPKAWI